MSGRCSLFQGIEQLYISPQYTTTCVSIHFLAELIILLVRPQQMLGLPCSPHLGGRPPLENSVVHRIPWPCVCHCGFLKTFCVFRVDLVAKGLCLYIVSLFNHVLLSDSGIQFSWVSCTLRRPCFLSCYCLFTGLLNSLLYFPHHVSTSVAHLGSLFCIPGCSEQAFLVQ